MKKKLNRRHFIQKSTLAGASLAGFPAAALATEPEGVAKPQSGPLRVGIIGSGLRG